MKISSFEPKELKKITKELKRDRETLTKKLPFYKKILYSLKVKFKRI